MMADSGEPLSPHCYYCGSKECIEGRFLTRICPKLKDHTEENEVMIKVGDKVTRMVAGGVPMMECTVSEIDDKFIHCGAWKFDKKTGAEVDEYLGWGVVDADGTVRTGTYLKEMHD